MKNSFNKKLKNGLTLFNNKTILHTSPHPDDVTLGYLPYITWLLRNSNNHHYFLTMTSGSNAVRNNYLVSLLDNLEKNFINRYKNKPLEDKISKSLLNFVLNKDNLLHEIQLLKSDLNKNINNHKLDILKSLIREYEEESVWKSLGIEKEKIIHFQAKFYYQKKEDLSIDIENFYNLLLSLEPDIITLAVDSKDKGPATHYKTFLVIKSAVKTFYDNTKKNIKIIGYHNVWHKFSPEQANIFFPVYDVDFYFLNTTFISCYKTQVDAMFPSPYFEGNFAELSINIMKENYSILKDFLNYDQISKIKGFCFLRQFDIDDFLVNFIL